MLLEPHNNNTCDYFVRVVGKTALTGDHCWILFEDILTGKFQTNLLNEVRF